MSNNNITVELELRVRILEEVHNYWEFHAKNEEQFDAWLHWEIREAIDRRDLTDLCAPHSAPSL